ncbi:MAG: hypothetical protein AAGH48_03735 [Pseudomonadota bacterium]
MVRVAFFSRALAAMALASLTACGDGGTPGRGRAGYCEINYSTLPNSDAAERLGEDLIETLPAWRASYKTERRFIEAFAPLTAEAIELVAGDDLRADDIGSFTLYGGYKGVTSPSLALQIGIDRARDRELVAKIGAALGYLYLQDSVLIHCSAGARDRDASPVYDLKDHKKVDALNSETIKSVYGMMIGAANGDLSLGFSYYENEDVLRVIGTNDGASTDRDALMDAVAYIGHLSEDGDELEVTISERNVSFPSNDWTESPNGDLYFETALDESLREPLDRLQARFLGAIDRMSAGI